MLLGLVSSIDTSDSLFEQLKIAAARSRFGLGYRKSISLHMQDEQHAAVWLISELHADSRQKESDVAAKWPVSRGRSDIYRFARFLQDRETRHDFPFPAADLRGNGGICAVALIKGNILAKVEMKMESTLRANRDGIYFIGRISPQDCCTSNVALIFNGQRGSKLRHQ